MRSEQETPKTEVKKPTLAEVVAQIQAGKGTYDGQYTYTHNLSPADAIALIESVGGK